MSTAEELLRDFEDDEEDFEVGDDEEVDEEPEQQEESKEGAGVSNDFDRSISTADELTRLHSPARPLLHPIPRARKTRHHSHQIRQDGCHHSKWPLQRHQGTVHIIGEHGWRPA